MDYPRPREALRTQPEKFITNAAKHYNNFNEANQARLREVLALVVKETLMRFEDWQCLERALVACYGVQTAAGYALASCIQTAVFASYPGMWLRMQEEVVRAALRQKRAALFEEQLIAWVRGLLQSQPCSRIALAKLFQRHEGSVGMTPNQQNVLSIVWMATLTVDPMLWLGGYVAKGEKAAERRCFLEFRTALAEWRDFGFDDPLNESWQRIASAVAAIDNMYGRQ